MQQNTTIHQNEDLLKKKKKNWNILKLYMIASG